MKQQRKKSTQSLLVSLRGRQANNTNITSQDLDQQDDHIVNENTENPTLSIDNLISSSSSNEASSQVKEEPLLVQIKVPIAKTLGEWAGLCKIDSEGKARKVVKCGCVVGKDYGGNVCPSKAFEMSRNSHVNVGSSSNISRQRIEDLKEQVEILKEKLNGYEETKENLATLHSFLQSKFGSK
ncbi:40S ribosomal protein S12 [Capsicum annuum]|uniref:40S ribosomal protein S12 n=1 Tax=Capsicum annuum TaxID=4072 RepID=A0A2G2YXZ4_CAPAN|nr:40S ribosomal protein S12 [Capsicum annuum]